MVLKMSGADFGWRMLECDTVGKRGCYPCSYCVPIVTSECTLFTRMRKGDKLSHLGESLLFNLFFLLVKADVSHPHFSTIALAHSHSSGLQRHYSSRKRRKRGIDIQTSLVTSSLSSLYGNRTKIQALKNVLRHPIKLLLQSPRPLCLVLLISKDLNTNKISQKVCIQNLIGCHTSGKVTKGPGRVLQKTL